MNKTLGIIVLVVVFLAAIFGIGVFKFNVAVNDKSIGVNIGGGAGGLDATYRIDGKTVTLKNGSSVVESAPGSSSKITTWYFGNEVKHDFNADGREDVAFILSQQTGGSGTFYYAVAALNTRKGYVGSDAVFLGDRIAPQTTEMGKGNVVIVNYVDRKPGEAFTTQPSIGKSLYLLLDTKTMQFREVAQNSN